MSVVSQSLTNIFRNRIVKSPNKTAFKRKIDSKWEDISFQEYYNIVQEICFSLLEVGIERGDRVSILSNSRTEWAFADLGILSTGAVTVPIYQSSTPSEIQYILNNAESKAIFVEDEVQLNKVLEIKSKLPHLKTIIIFNYKNSKSLDGAYPLEEFCQKGLLRKNSDPKAFDELLKQNRPDDMATIVYTSGTTGVPKGVVLTHGNFLSALGDVEKDFSVLSEDDVILSFLPFAHILARIELYLGLVFGWEHAFAESVPKLVDNLSEIRPTFMFAVPRIYEKVYNKILSQVQDGSPLKQKIFYWSLDIGKQVSALLQQRKALPALLKVKYAIATKLVFSKLQAKFGGRVRFFISGGAPLSGDIARFFHAAGFLILEGYGLTETTAACVLNRLDSFEFGTVGRPLGDLELKIANDGEILMRSKKVFKEYYKNPEATAEVLFKDGWFATGDVGHIQENGLLKITDRKKDLIITAGGKNIAPQKIENLLKTCRYVSQAMVYGDKQKYLSVLVTLNAEEIESFIKNNNLNITNDAVHTNQRIIDLVKGDIEAVNKKLPQFETLKKFYILKDDFTIEAGELTPSMKVKRKFCSEKYKSELQSMYA